MMSFIMMMMSLMMLWMKHPLSMGLLLVIQTMITSLIAGNMMNSFWTSYILFIIMLSGSLVLFIYMSSIASNEKFNTSIKMITLSPIMILLGLVILMTNDNMSNNKKMVMMENKTMVYEQTMMMTKLFSNYSMMTITMVMYLLITMIVVTHNVNIFEGPMRQKS